MQLLKVKEKMIKHTNTPHRLNEVYSETNKKKILLVLKSPRGYPWYLLSVRKNPPANAGDAGSVPGSGRSLGETEMATHCSILAWEVPWTVEPGGLQSVGSPETPILWPSDAKY